VIAWLAWAGREFAPPSFAQERAAEPIEPGEPLPMTVLEKTGRVLPRLGFGGFPISRLATDEEAAAVVRHAIDLGVRYMDTAPSYGNGKSERRIGRAVRECGLERGEFFIATKTRRRDADGARRELEQSLQYLQTEYVDSVQVHAVHDDFESVFAEESVLKALERARDEGLVRHIGITGHANPKYLTTCIRRYPFATALVPINPIDTKHLSFVREFLPVAREEEVAVIGMKVYGGGSLLRAEDVQAGELLQYALSQEGVNVVVPGCEKIAYVDEAFEAAAGFEAALDAERQSAIEDKVGPHRGRQSEWYKEGG